MCWSNTIGMALCYTTLLLFSNCYRERYYRLRFRDKYLDVWKGKAHMVLSVGECATHCLHENGSAFGYHKITNYCSILDHFEENCSNCQKLGFRVYELIEEQKSTTTKAPTVPFENAIPVKSASDVLTTKSPSVLGKLPTTSSPSAKSATALAVPAKVTKSPANAIENALATTISTKSQSTTTPTTTSTTTKTLIDDLVPVMPVNDPVPVMPVNDPYDPFNVLRQDTTSTKTTSATFISKTTASTSEKESTEPKCKGKALMGIFTKGDVFLEPSKTTTPCSDIKLKNEISKVESTTGDVLCPEGMVVKDVKFDTSINEQTGNLAVNKCTLYCAQPEKQLGLVMTPHVLKSDSSGYHVKCDDGSALYRLIYINGQTIDIRFLCKPVGSGGGYVPPVLG